MPLFEKLVEQSEIVPLDESVGRVAADIYAELRRQGQLIADADLLIGATAIAADAVLVTNNEDHYERVPGLAVENWMSKDRD
jgi:predicted nucleic acid-binding protein